MQNKGFVNILIAIVVIVLMGGGYYFYSTQKTEEKETQNIAQLTKEQVLSGYDECGVQFKNGSTPVWEEKSFGECDAGSINLSTDQIVFADLDGDGINEALVPGRVVRASSGGALYVFKNIEGVANVVSSIYFGKENVRVVSASGNIIEVEIEPVMGYPGAMARYRFENGKLVEESH